MVSDFGKLFDPIADKILINSVLIIFAIQMRIPAFVPIIFIVRDILVEGLRMLSSSKNIIIPANQ
jgi:CDP-diacylglycerol--glycerol-3-phosphate 3-phosphatidyltransferase